MLAAGLDGIKKNMELPDPIECNIFELTEKERRELGIEQLPEDLLEAIHLAEKSELVRYALGDHVFTRYIENKKIEWEKYRAHVSDYELDHYLPLL